MVQSSTPHIGIIGGGFCGLAAAYELSRTGARVTLLEADPQLGGLAGSFDVNGVSLEKFYHHWFNNDAHIMDLVGELEVQDRILLRPSRTGMYYANRLFRLSSPLDLLRFTPLPFLDRIRLGLLALKARRVADWRELESVGAAEWLRSLGGDRVYKVVWEPLLRGKFGDYAEDISAVWFWNKLKLRGGSRGKGGQEQLAYYRGGFAALAERMAEAIRGAGGDVRTSAPVTGISVTEGRIAALHSGAEAIAVDAVIATPALPLVADLVAGHVDKAYEDQLRRIHYIANVCLVLELDHSLSDIYWLNVNDPGFPFVGIIEHTNFEPIGTYGDRHIVYLSKYLPESDPMFAMDADQLLDFALPHIQRMFPAFDRNRILDHHVWRARHSQPIVERHYSKLIPDVQTPLDNLLLASMAQIYPEDRGTNYAIGQGRDAARRLMERF